MESRRFDALARALAGASSRRAAVAGVLTALAPLSGAARKNRSRDHDDPDREARRRPDGPDAEACVANGQRCGPGSGRRGKPCAKCCSKHAVAQPNGKRRCACKPAGMAARNAAQCCSGRRSAGGFCGACDPGLTECAGDCVDTATDGANCGACGNACAAAQACESGTCACTPATCPDGCCDGDDCVATGSACAGGFCCATGGGACDAGAECCAAADCPDVACQAKTCTAGACAYENLADGTPCATYTYDDVGGVTIQMPVRCCGGACPPNPTCIPAGAWCESCEGNERSTFEVCCSKAATGICPSAPDAPVGRCDCNFRSPGESCASDADCDALSECRCGACCGLPGAHVNGCNECCSGTCEQVGSFEYRCT